MRVRPTPHAIQFGANANRVVDRDKSHIQTEEVPRILHRQGSTGAESVIAPHRQWRQKSASRRSAPILPTPLRSSYEAQTENDFAIVFIGSKSLSLSSGSSMKPYFR